MTPLKTPRVRAPELPQNALWLNVDRPLTLSQLRGGVVLLHFWTHGCINCLQVLPDLAYLETKYGDRLVIISVHSPKFATEKTETSLRQAVRRYDITHPVVLDADLSVWEQYAVRAWPTCVLVDSRGYDVGRALGEGHRDELDGAIASLLDTAASPENPVPLQLDKQSRPHRQPLAFPSKVLATPDAIYIADTGHHRLVVVTAEGELLETVGSGTPGFADGEFANAQFNRPQGLAFDRAKSCLYLADTANHAIRCLDFRRRCVSTVSRELNSPWDVEFLSDILFIAMAGSHQIWAIDLDDNTLGLYAGTGAEGCFDGSLDDAAFAQPSGLATDGDILYVADSEISSVRSVGLDADAEVRTLCGSGGLFDFGDRDGIGEAVRLQHCLGIAYGRETLYLADTYNHKIKRVRLPEGRCETLLVEGLEEPSGLSLLGTRLYIADTNHHAIRVLDIDTGELATLAISGLCAPNLCLPDNLSGGA
ncbi:thioredoxin-like domain-containing protein [Baaleninema simplex]|uniref:thioredoxin-like domain-containing protein n=1 Tax=Baaleninema simplex TaxID=2862350 RepID=UPI000346C8FC|nr:thioredoxin-like domain-containing protein [Baaleninema simplex]